MAGSDERACQRIAVGINGYPEGRDAAVLANLIAGVTGAELLLVAVHPDPLLVVPTELGWTAMREQSLAMLRETRDSLAPRARTVVETDWSVPRALQRVLEREHRDLLVVGSSGGGPDGVVDAGPRARQLLDSSPCPLAVAPRGLRDRTQLRLLQIGVGFDGSAESDAALALAGSLAEQAGATLLVRGVIDDRLPMLGGSSPTREEVRAMWSELAEPEVVALRERAQHATDERSAAADVDVGRGSPVEALIEVSDIVDLFVIGSRRWGTAARVLLGSTGEALMHSARCPILVVPRPEP
jgi:nucleotide-binding universal stress UspA family protein